MRQSAIQEGLARDSNAQVAPPIEMPRPGAECGRLALSLSPSPSRSIYVYEIYIYVHTHIYSRYTWMIGECVRDILRGIHEKDRINLTEGLDRWMAPQRLGNAEHRG